MRAEHKQLQPRSVHYPGIPENCRGVEYHGDKQPRYMKAVPGVDKIPYNGHKRTLECDELCDSRSEQARQIVNGGDRKPSAGWWQDNGCTQDLEQSPAITELFISSTPREHLRVIGTEMKPHSRKTSFFADRNTVKNKNLFFHQRHTFWEGGTTKSMFIRTFQRSRRAMLPVTPVRAVVNP